MAIQWDEEIVAAPKYGSKPKKGIQWGESQAALSSSQRIADSIFSQKPQDNGFQNPLTQMDPTGQQGKAFLQESLPTAGAIAGGTAGGILGSTAGPLGTYGGAVAGTTAGAALGESAKGLAQGAFDPKQSAKTGLEFGALEAIGGPVASGIGKLVKGTGKWLAKAVIPKSAQEAERTLNYKAANPILERLKSVFTGAKPKGKEPITAAETAFQKGLLGPESWVGTQAKREGDQVWKEVIEPKLKASKTQHDMPKFFDDVEKQIIKDNPEPGRQADLKEALAAMREEYIGKPTASTEDIQSFKEGWAKFVPEKAYKGKPIAGAYKDVQNVAAGKAREVLYKELGDEGKQAYIDYGNLKALKELGVKAIQEGTVPVGGTGTILNHLLQKIAIPVGTVGGQTIYKVGEGIELIGKPGARTVRDVVGTLGGVGRESAQDTSTFSLPLQNTQ